MIGLQPPAPQIFLPTQSVSGDYAEGRGRTAIGGPECIVKAAHAAKTGSKKQYHTTALWFDRSTVSLPVRVASQQYRLGSRRYDGETAVTGGVARHPGARQVPRLRLRPGIPPRSVAYHGRLSSRFRSMPGFPVPFRDGSEGRVESLPARRRLPNQKTRHLPTARGVPGRPDDSRSGWSAHP